MSEAKKRLYLSVIKRKMAQGESLDDILAEIHTLTDEEKEELRREIEGE